MVAVRRLIPWILCLVLIQAESVPAKAGAAEDLVRTLGDRAIASLTAPDLSTSERQDRFRAILREGFDIDFMGRFVLGRYWRSASPAQRKEFLALFEDFVVQAYASRFKNYAGETLSVSAARDAGSDKVVPSSIVRKSGPPIRVDWRVRTTNGISKIVDVAVEGVSMAVTQRDEFAAVIQRNGGKVAGLIEALRRKTGKS